MLSIVNCSKRARARAQIERTNKKWKALSVFDVRFEHILRVQLGIFGFTTIFQWTQVVSLSLALRIQHRHCACPFFITSTRRDGNKLTISLEFSDTSGWMSNTLSFSMLFSYFWFNETLYLITIEIISIKLSNHSLHLILFLSFVRCVL